MKYRQRLIKNMIKGLIVGVVIMVMILIAKSNSLQRGPGINVSAIPLIMIVFSLLGFGGTRPYPSSTKKILQILITSAVSIIIFTFVYLVLLFPTSFGDNSNWGFFEKLGVCLIWVIPLVFCAFYQFFYPIKDESEIMETAEKGDGISSEELMSKPRVKQFYDNTMKAWASGELDALNRRLKREGSISYDRFVKLYKPKKYNALYIFFSQYEPMDNEYLIGFGEHSYGTNRDWFILTNKRLIQRDGADKKFKEIILEQVEEYELDLEKIVQLSFKMKSGEIINFRSLELMPLPDYLDKV